MHCSVKVVVRKLWCPRARCWRKFSRNECCGWIVEEGNGIALFEIQRRIQPSEGQCSAWAFTGDQSVASPTKGRFLLFALLWLHIFGPSISLTSPASALIELLVSLQLTEYFHLCCSLNFPSCFVTSQFRSEHKISFGGTFLGLPLLMHLSLFVDLAFVLCLFV